MAHSKKNLRDQDPGNSARVSHARSCEQSGECAWELATEDELFNGRSKYGEAAQERQFGKYHDYQTGADETSSEREASWQTALPPLVRTGQDEDPR